MKKLLTESWYCTTNLTGTATCNCGIEQGACPAITVWGDCGAGGTGTGAWNGFDSCSKYCKGGCSASVDDDDNNKRIKSKDQDIPPRLDKVLMRRMQELANIKKK